jgi:hypothetical protein
LSFCVSGDPPSWPLLLCTSRSFSIISAKRGSVFLSPVLRSACTQPRTSLNVPTETRIDHGSIGSSHRWTASRLAEVVCLNYRQDIRGSIPGKERSRPALGPSQFSMQWVLGPDSTGLKRSVCKVVHSSPSSAEVKNSGAIPPLPHTSSCRRGNFLHIIYRLILPGCESHTMATVRISSHRCWAPSTSPTVCSAHLKLNSSNFG